MPSTEPLILGNQFNWRDSGNVPIDMVLDADVAGITVRVNETQTNDPIQVLDNADARIASFTKDGNLRLGTGLGVLDQNSNEQVLFTTTASAVNEMTHTNAATGNAPRLASTGGDTNIGMDLSSKGTGSVTLWSGNVAREILIGVNTASAVNELTVTPAATGNAVSIKSTGDDANVGLDLDGKGSGAIRLNNTGTGNITTPRAVLSSGATAGMGYTTGAGGTVTQATSKSTGVTLNTVTGIITMNGAALAADTTVSFVLTDSAIAATDAVLVLHESAGTLGAYSFASTAAGGSATIGVHNNTPGALSEAIVLRFVVVKSVNA